MTPEAQASDLRPPSRAPNGLRRARFRDSGRLEQQQCFQKHKVSPPAATAHDVLAPCRILPRSSSASASTRAPTGSTSRPITGDDRGGGQGFGAGRRRRSPIIASRTERTILRRMGQEPSTASPLLDEALSLAERLAEDAASGRVDLADRAPRPEAARSRQQARRVVAAVLTLGRTSSRTASTSRARADRRSACSSTTSAAASSRSSVRRRGSGATASAAARRANASMFRPGTARTSTAPTASTGA